MEWALRGFLVWDPTWVRGRETERGGRYVCSCCHCFSGVTWDSRQREMMKDERGV